MTQLFEVQSEKKALAFYVQYLQLLTYQVLAVRE